MDKRSKKRIAFLKTSQILQSNNLTKDLQDVYGEKWYDFIEKHKRNLENSRGSKFMDRKIR